MRQVNGTTSRQTGNQFIDLGIFIYIFIYLFIYLFIYVNLYLPLVYKSSRS